MKYILPIEEIIKKYQDGDSLRTLGFEYNVSYDTIQQILIKNNIERRKVGNQPFYYVNHDIFDNIDHLKARILRLYPLSGMHERKYHFVLQIHDYLESRNAV